MAIPDLDGVSRQLFTTPVRPAPAATNVQDTPNSASRRDKHSPVNWQAWHEASLRSSAHGQAASQFKRSHQVPQRSTGSFKAPTGYDRHAARGPGRPSNTASYRVPLDEEFSSSDSDADHSNADSEPLDVHLAASSAYRTNAVVVLAKAHARSIARTFAEMQEVHRVQLHEEMEGVAADLAKAMEEVAGLVEQRKAKLQGADAKARAQRSAERERRMRDLQQRQQQSQQQQERRIAEAKAAADADAARRAAAEEAHRKKEEQERQRLEQQRRQQQEEEEAAKKLKEQEAKRQAEEKQKQERQQHQQQQQPSAAQSQPSTAAASQPDKAAPSTRAAAGAAGPAPGVIPRLSASAAASEKDLAAKLQAAEAVSEQLCANAASKQPRRQLEKRITLLVSQISGTQAQVDAKVRDLLEVIGGCKEPSFRSHACLTLAARVISQCESQISRINSFAFPVAFVVVRVAAHVPELMDLLLAKLHKACILTVPKFYSWRPSGGTSKEQVLQLLGYNQVEDSKAPGGKRLESEDEYVARMSAYVLLYASMVQADVKRGERHPLPLDRGWTYIAQLLNALPANRSTAYALMAFLNHAGYRLHQQYRRQFVKLLHAVHDTFLPELAAKDDADARAVVTRLTTYLHGQQYLKEPQGRHLVAVDESSWERA